jgi:trehalose 6-phosphate phosphatase
LPNLLEHIQFQSPFSFKQKHRAVLQVRLAVEGIAAGHRELLITRGRKVLELRPAVAWDKGHAVLHFLKALSLHDAPDVAPIYIGDDRTDEDAFKALRGRGGVGILVSSIAKPTAATFSLRDPEEVRPAA